MSPSDTVMSLFTRRIVVAAISLAWFLLSTNAHASGQAGLFIVGVDGMDPVITQRLMDEGKMPNFSKLANEGTFQRLGTANPPQSPVAWSNFVTGMNPGGHGIFDFIHRDPANYHPVSSATPAVDDPGSAFHLFGYVFPIGAPDRVNNRGGTPWWDVLVDHDIDVEVFRIPGNFPNPESEAKVLGGMGTVDLRGGFGTYTLYTNSLVEKKNPKGDVEYVTVHDLDLDGTPETVTSALRGPPDTFHLEPGAIPTHNQYLTQGVTVHIDAESDTAVIEISGQRALIEQGEWSEWLEVRYDAMPMGLMPVDGMVRFYAMELHPNFRLYASPVNLSPASPAMAISSPDEFAEDIYEKTGFFYTQGLPEETDALNDGVFSDDDYLGQVSLIQQDTRRMIELALDRFETGDATFVYLSDIDLQSHMLWRHGDPKYPDAPRHPAYRRDLAEKHAKDIENFYRDVDESLGAIRKRLPEGTLLIVMSDHGFQPFTRELHLNAWLRNKGYLVMKPEKNTGYFVTNDVDWTKTRAYGLGFNGLYINLAGREAQGIVELADSDALLGQLSRSLEAYRDPDGGGRVVRRVARGSEIYTGDRATEGPDLVVGYEKGYGCSDESTLGEITKWVIEDNESRWSGNHLMAPEVVPGVLFVNRNLAADGHDLTDLTATVLSHFGIDKLPGMIGEPVL